MTKEYKEEKINKNYHQMIKWMSNSGSKVIINGYLPMNIKYWDLEIINK